MSETGMRSSLNYSKSKALLSCTKSKIKEKKEKNKTRIFLYIRIWMDYGRVWKRISVLLFLLVFEMLIVLLRIEMN
jgi:hypothetical protein